ncbi:hypothetical protein B4U37_19005 [Sutcliffiella horikoshii]|uniref:Uncharacterized protein n=1 Tax=Sutcliffiella horikoshii TaxID=79883 RepID=A0ABN4ZKL2_9BACI|nr:hypothetical protein B4U37_19005 [Sutcliffiella horikoshii]
MEQKAKTPAGEEATLLRPRNEVRRLKVAPRKAKPFAEINSGFKRNQKTRTFEKSGSRFLLILFLQRLDNRLLD